MQVFFYLPEKYLPDATREEAWKSGTIMTLEEGGKIASAQSWIYQTWLLLRQEGAPVRLTHTLPSEGILVTLTGCVGASFRPAPEVYFAGIAADGLPHPAAHLHLVQNAAHAQKLPGARFMPHWPHPNLIPRDPARGERFENVAFYGPSSNLFAPLRDPEAAKRIGRETGLRLEIVPAARWHDYASADCVLGVRGFAPALRKPATKLYNAWLAGAPFVGGPDSAYAADGAPGGDYLRADSPDDVFLCLRRLKEDPALRRRITEAGRRKAAAFDRAATLRRWMTLVTDTLPRAASVWRERSAFSKRWDAARRSVHAWIDARVR